MAITTTIINKKPSRVEADILVFLMNDSKEVIGGFGEIKSQILRSAKEHDFNGEWGQAIVFPAFSGVAAIQVAFIGIGKSNDNNRLSEAVRRGVGQIVREAQKKRLKSVAIRLAGKVEENVKAVIDGFYLSDYVFTEYSKSKAKKQAKQSVGKLILLVSNNVAGLRKIIQERKIGVNGVVMTRDLVNQPANSVSPESLVKKARKISSDSKNIQIKVMNRAQAKKKKFNAFLAVARGSKEEPYVIHLTYKPTKSDKDTKKIFLVGKGVTFDSGGLSLKPADFMESMKADMAGAATVLGVFSVLDKISPNVEVHGVIAACENMPSGDAYRPGDVLTAKNGKTIEVANTDAEGRITLADALTYAVEQKPDAVIDLATLTGACVVALGETVGGLWGNDKKLSFSVISASKKEGESMVELPMPDEYRSLIDSDIADLRNISSSRYGGAITAAMFLREFVGDVPWVHLDIAGPAYAEKVNIPYNGKGATGFGVRTILRFLKTTR